MKLLALTGQIAMGKSFIAGIFRSLKIDVFDSDLEVRKLLSNKEIIKKIRTIFPTVIKDEEIDKIALSKIVFENKSSKKKLESILHPAVRKKQIDFIKKARLKQKKLVVIDIPLLYEIREGKNFDYIMLATCSKLIQTKRALKRKNMNKEKLRSIIKNQISDSRKRQLADFLIYTGLKKSHIVRQIKIILKRIK